MAHLQSNIGRELGNCLGIRHACVQGTMIQRVCDLTVLVAFFGILKVAVALLKFRRGAPRDKNRVDNHIVNIPPVSLRHLVSDTETVRS